MRVSKSPNQRIRTKNASKNDNNNSVVCNNSKVTILRNFLKQENSFRNSYNITDLSYQPKKLCKKNKMTKKRQQNKSNMNNSKSFFMKQRYRSQDNVISLNDYNTRPNTNVHKRKATNPRANPNSFIERANKSISNQLILSKSLDDTNKLNFYKSDVEDACKPKLSKSKNKDIKMKIMDKIILAKNVSANNSIVTEYHDLINKAKNRIQQQVLYMSLNKEQKLSSARNHVSNERKMDLDKVENQEIFKPVYVDAPNKKFVTDIDNLRSSTEEYFCDAKTSSKEKFSDLCQKSDLDQNTIIKNSLFARKSCNNNDFSKLYSQ